MMFVSCMSTQLGCADGLKSTTRQKKGKGMRRRVAPSTLLSTMADADLTNLAPCSHEEADTYMQQMTCAALLVFHAFTCLHLGGEARKEPEVNGKYFQKLLRASF